MRSTNYLILLMLIGLSACSGLKRSPKTEFADGFYSRKIDGKKETVYVDIDNDTLRIHPLKNGKAERIIDTTVAFEVYHSKMKTQDRFDASFNKYSFDIDFLTIPLKFRPGQSNVPSQLNANLNGAVYLGYRVDNYKVNSVTNPLGISDLDIDHFGFSMGFFTGFGNTFISPTTTNEQQQQEYDGFVWSKGIAGIIAVNKFTVGLALGFDNLLDKNSSIWIYKQKAWLGLAFGLNLN